MASTFTTNKSLEQPGNGDYVDTWNVPLNFDMSVLDQALGSTTYLNATSGSATLSVSQYRSLILDVSGAVSGNVVYTIPSGVGGQWIIRNTITDASGGPWTVTLASAGGGTSVVVPRNANTVYFCDGTNVRDITVSVFTAGSTDQVLFNDGIGITGSSDLTFDGTTLSAANLDVAGTSSFDDISSSGTAALTTATVAGTLTVNNTTTLYSLSVNTNIAAAGSITATGNITAFSDERLKRDIRTIDDALAKISMVRGVHYVSQNTDQPGIGVIAQEVQKVIPEAVQDNGGMLSVAYGNLVGLLIEGIKELQARVEKLEARNDAAD